MLIHKTPVVSLSSYINFDEFKNGDKEFLISCSLDPDIKIYDLETNSCIKTIDSTHTKNITACLFVKRDGIFQLLTASMDQTIQLIDLSEGVLVSNFYGHKGVVNCLVQAEDIFDFNAFVSGSDDGTIKIWKYESSDPLIDIKVESQIKSMTSLKKFDENVKFAVAVGLQNGNILIYDCVAGKKINSMTHAIRSNNNEFAVTALENFFYKENNRLILSGCTNGSIKIWNSNNGNLIKSYEENKKMISSLICFTLEEKQYFVSGSIEKGDGEIILYTLEEDKSIKTLSNFGYGVNSLRYLTKYQYLVVSWNNGYRILKLNEELKG